MIWSLEGTRASMQADNSGRDGLPRMAPSSVAGLLLALLFLVGQAQAQSLSGLHVGNDIGATRMLGKQPSATQKTSSFTTSKWALPNGNDLSVTSSGPGRKIVFLESDFGGRRSGLASDYPGFSFVETSLADVRSRLGSNGFAFKGGPAGIMSGGVVQSNCYPVAGDVDTIACFITLIKNSDEQKVRDSPSSVSRFAKLTSIIIANEGYLELIWGKDRVFDPACKPIDW